MNIQNNITNPASKIDSQKKDNVISSSFQTNNTKKSPRPTAKQIRLAVGV